MRKKILTLLCLAACGSAALADTEQTVTVDGSGVDKFVTAITFDGDNAVLTFEDNTTQTADMSLVAITLNYDPVSDGITAAAGERAGTGSVYTIAGQYAGESTAALKKGVYVVKGKKLIIK